MYKSDEEKLLTCNSSRWITGDIDVEGFSLSKLARAKIHVKLVFSTCCCLFSRL